MKKINDYQNFAKEIRKQILLMSYHAKVGHVGSSFSIVEILIALYFGILKVDPKNPKSHYRDRFILSKGHAAPALYVILKEKGFLSKKDLDHYCRNGELLEEHPTHRIPGVDVSTGSLGHGLPIGVGMALSAKLLKRTNKVFVLLSDAECDEGETWEAVLSASHFKLENLIVFLDYNRVQALGTKKEVLNIEPLIDKWISFGWYTQEVDGHDVSDIKKAYKKTPLSNKPSIIICHTIRGKGVSFMEHKIEWHYLNPSSKDVKGALKELA